MMPAMTAYQQLLHEVKPEKIESKKEHTRLLAEMKRLMLKGKTRTSAESSMLKTIGVLVRDYEQNLFSPAKITPAEMLKYLMEQGKVKAADLPLPAPRVSEILAGKRKINNKQAIALAKRFHVSPDLFQERLTL